MSIILKGIDMPEKGEFIHVLITSNGNFGIISDKNVDIGFRKAIQIPKGHGRLVDADELKESIEEVDRPSGYTALVHIQYAPTILEAEETDEFDIERD